MCITQPLQQINYQVARLATMSVIAPVMLPQDSPNDRALEAIWENTADLDVVGI